MKPSVLLVDGYSLIFRGFHALPLLTGPDGTPTNAVHGFFAMLVKALAEYRPQALCVMMDMHAPTFRHSLYPDYKGTRKPMPEELRPQLPLMREILSAMNIRICELEGYEADDLLGTVAKAAGKQGYQPYILTGDRDSLQLVDEEVRVILTRKGITESLLLDPAGVLANFGFTPSQVPDMKGLMGDSSDNIPGIPGIGEKTALKLMSEYGTLDNILAHGEEIKGKLGEKIRAGRDMALLSRDLGTIRTQAPLEVKLEECTWSQMEKGAEILEKYGLNATLKSIRSLLGGEGAPRLTGAAKRSAGTTPSQSLHTMESEKEESLPAPAPIASQETLEGEKALSQAVSALLEEQPEWLALAMQEGEITLLTPERKLFHIPLMVDLLGQGLGEDQALALLSPVLSQIPITLHHAKQWNHLLSRNHLPPVRLGFDTMLAAYLLHTAQRDYGLNGTLAAEYGETPALVNAHTLYGLRLRQQARLESRGLVSLLRETEQPLSQVLFSMEEQGFLVDRKVLAQLGEQFTKEVDSSREKVYQECGFRDFNLNSPRQLGEVLFDRLGLPAPQKKGKTGYSTSAEVLEELAPYHPCIEPLLRYRKISKLQSTYIEGLQKPGDQDGRIRTTFDQTATVTGRISSLEPNLQNIPIRTEEGREIRRAFVAGEGMVLLDADYSQIELRVLAHMSGDEAMCDAFLRGQDIHTRTAAEIQGVPMEQVTQEMRRAAKAINFGIVYGISAFGLSRNTGISRQEAKTFIDRYFQRYPGVRAFMDDCVKQGYDRGYAQTLLGRRRELFELSSPNRNLRSFGERAAMNTPVQGTAADIIKQAMVAVHRRLTEEGWQGKLILQVHDELVIECPRDEAEPLSRLLKETMENIVTLKVPLVAEVHTGANWEEAH